MKKIPVSTMQLSYSAILMAVLSFECAIAQPALHRHHHKYRRAEVVPAGAPNVEVRDVDVSGVDWSKIDWSKVHYTYPAGSPSLSPTVSPPEAHVEVLSTPITAPVIVAPTPTTTPVVVAPKTNSDAGSGESSGVPVFGGRTVPKDNGNKDEYIGNVGNPYGSNIQKATATGAKNCKYSIKFVNNGGQSKNLILWNKSGRDGRPQSGMGDAPYLHLPIAAGQSQYVCFDENSQVAFSEDCPRNPSQGNLPDCTWGEADFGDLRNGGWSGYDRSSIPNTQGNTGYLTLSCPGGKTSSQGHNSFTDASQEDAGGAIAPGPAAITAEWR